MLIKEIFKPGIWNISLCLIFTFVVELNIFLNSAGAVSCMALGCPSPPDPKTAVLVALVPVLAVTYAISSLLVFAVRKLLKK